ncbi:MAG: helix-turn-helix domain-containing protein [Ruminococcaceae bacterium]|nr:helix-turn-helix domain-containing protein [Oscillospiraceae bacterium]
MIYNELIERGTEHFPIELYKVDKNHPRYEMSSHWHNEIELIRIISGKLLVKLNEREYTLEKGDIIFVNPETVHGASPIGECFYECIVMRLDMLLTADESCRFFIEGILNHDILVLEYHSDLSSPFSMAVNYLFDSMASSHSGYKFSVLSALYNMLGAIIDKNLYTSSSLASHNAQNNDLARLKAALSYIRSNYDKQLTLSDISVHSAMSEKYFCSFFKKMTAKTPMQYLILYRVERAAGKLLKTNSSITEIALSCGFNDISYFIKTFKKIKGTTPLKFRNQQ